MSAPHAVGLLLVIAVGACADDERAVVLSLAPSAVPGDRLCLTVSDDEGVRFEGEHDGDASGTLSLVAGAAVRDRVRVTARVSRGGRIVAAAVGEAHFEPPPGGALALTPTRCVARDDPRPGEVVLALDEGRPAHLLGADLDGDGFDEIVVVDEDGSLRVVDGARTVRAAGEMPAGARPSVAALRDAGCGLDVLGASDEGVVEWTGGGPPRATGAAVRRVAVGDLTGRGEGNVVSAGPSGVRVTAQDGTSPALTEAPAGAVVVADLTGDGVDDVVATTASGAVAFLGSDIGPRPHADALPPALADATTEIAAGDLDGDGHTDVVAAVPSGLVVAINRGDGLLEQRGPREGLAAEAATVDLLALDVDGDCRDEIVALDASGRLTVWTGSSDGGWSTVRSDPDVVAITSADLDGDGPRELVFLSVGGEIAVWSP